MGVLWNLYALALGKIMEELTAKYAKEEGRRKNFGGSLEPHPQPLSLVRRGENKECRVCCRVAQRTIFNSRRRADNS